MSEKRQNYLSVLSIEKYNITCHMKRQPKSMQIKDTEKVLQGQRSSSQLILKIMLLFWML